MTTRKIQPRERGSKLKKLTASQRMFCEHLAADPQFKPSAAARKAGYKVPAQSATKLLQNHAVMAYLGKVLRERIERCQLKADDVLEHLRHALFLDPLDLFYAAGDGMFEVKDLDDMPEHVRRCITKLRCKTRTSKDGDVETNIEIELISKEQALNLAMKHLGLISPESGPKYSVYNTVITQQNNPYRDADPEDIIEAKAVLSRLQHSNGHAQENPKDET